MRVMKLIFSGHQCAWNVMKAMMMGNFAHRLTSSSAIKNAHNHPIINGHKAQRQSFARDPL